MFGVVPRVLWAKEREPDAENRICLAMNVLLVEDGHRTTLIDTGAGSKLDPRTIRTLRAESGPAESWLEPTGLTPDRIDRVVNSHLHFDHAGGNTRPNGSGAPVATFPNAEYWVQQSELATARLDNEKIRAAYEAEDFEPLAAEQDRLHRVDGTAELDGGVRLHPAPGHTPGMQVIEIATDEGSVGFLADLVPMTSHLRFPWIMAFDLEPLRTLESKKTILRRAFDERWRLVFEHDPITPMATLVEGRRGYEARPWTPGG